MTRKEATEIMDEDDDYDQDGYLTEEAKERLNEEMSELNEEE